MSKKQPQKDTLGQESSQLPSFIDIESRVFYQGKNRDGSLNGKIYLGKEEINDAMRSALRDDAKMILSSRLWEVLNASVLNEAYTLALIKSQNYDHVEFAKALHHWLHFMKNVMFVLEK